MLVGFENMIPVFERMKTFHAVDRETTVISCLPHLELKNYVIV
jgi:hypothetical protein